MISPHHSHPTNRVSPSDYNLPNSDLKSSLAYPNGLTASWQYDANNQLLQVRNATPTNVISQYDYTYDVAGCRIQIAKSGVAFEFDDVVSYGYNARSELTNAVATVDANYHYSYQYDPIGNREASSECGTNTAYTANLLNQYMRVATADEDAFVPEFDDDGNQTLVKTATGIWSVTYNGENRPILWTCGDTNIVMSYDRKGRRVTKNDQRFVYDGYLQIADNSGNIYIWDPSENVATRPLVWMRGISVAYYTHDGNKNVSEIIAADGSLAARYEYAPFGAITSSRGTFAAANPWRFSSEFTDDELGCDYYNYREYEPMTGRWLCRDDVDELTLYLLCVNNAIVSFDLLGNRSYSYEFNLKQNKLGYSFYGRVSVNESDCPKEIEVEVLMGVEWQPPQLRAANLVLNLFHVYIEGGVRGLVGGKARVSECLGKSTSKICGRLEVFARAEYRAWKVKEMGRRHRFTRSRFGIGADGGGTACIDLTTGDLTVQASFNYYAYAHFGWKWFNRTYDFGGSFETGEGKVVTLESMKLLPPIKEGGNYGCCCEKKYGKK